MIIDDINVILSRGSHRVRCIHAYWSGYFYQERSLSVNIMVEPQSVLSVHISFSYFFSLLPPRKERWSTDMSYRHYLHLVGKIQFQLLSFEH